MQQSILALGALMIIMVIAINHQRSFILLQEQSYVRELENAALDLAKIEIDRILNTTGFDEASLALAALPTAESDMTPFHSFGLDGGDTVFDDVDDYHNYTALGVIHVIGADTFLFNISYRVNYVNSSTGDTTSSQTFLKLLTAEAESLAQVGNRNGRATWSKTVSITDNF